MLTGIAVALIDLVLTAVPSVTSHTCTGEAGNAIYTSAMVARIWRAVINVFFTQSPFKTFCTTAFISIGPVHALGTILAWCAGTLINVYLAHRTREA